MTITQDNQLAVSDVRSRLDEIQAGIAALVEQRQMLMTTTCAELAAAGIEAHVIRYRYTAPVEAGDIGTVQESYFFSNSQEFNFRLGEMDPRERGPYFSGPGLVIERGRFKVLLVDGNEVLVARVPDDHADEEAAHKRAVSRLRTLAKSEGMRVRTRDREVDIIDPFNSTAHSGDVSSAFKWLMGFAD